MASTREPHPVLVWYEPAQASLVRGIVERAGLRVIGAGVPAAARRSASTVEHAGFDGAKAVTDLRMELATTEARFILLAASAGSDTGPAADAAIDDAEIIRVARSRNLTILSFDPIPASAADARAADAPAWIDSCRTLGLFKDCTAMRGAPELLESFGTPRTLSVGFRCGKGQGTLGARLFDAMHAVHWLMGMPESIDASVVTQVGPSGVRLAPAEYLRRLRGDLTANLRYAGAKAAAVSLSDRAGRWFRGLSIVGEGGCLRMDETGIERIDAEGATVEQSPEPTTRKRTKKPTLFDAAVDQGALEALASSAARAVDPHAPRPEPYALLEVLAMCEAAMLSARTGQPESPATVLMMAGQ